MFKENPSHDKFIVLENTTRKGLATFTNIVKMIKIINFFLYFRV